MFDLKDKVAVVTGAGSGRLVTSRLKSAVWTLPWRLACGSLRLGFVRTSEFEYVCCSKSWFCSLIW